MIIMHVIPMLRNFLQNLEYEHIITAVLKTLQAYFQLNPLLLVGAVHKWNRELV